MAKNNALGRSAGTLWVYPGGLQPIVLSYVEFVKLLIFLVDI